jgi:hypothetical protein
MLQVTRDTFVRIVLYYPSYIYGTLDSGSRGKGSKIGVMTLRHGWRMFDGRSLYLTLLEACQV